MKLKAAEGDGCYVESVLLDGVEIKNKCFALDTEAGTAECFVYDERGEPVLSEDGETIKSETLRGAVVVVISPSESVGAD